MNNSARPKVSLYEKEQVAYTTYFYGKMYDKVKGRPYGRQLEIMRKALLTDPEAPKLTVYSPPGMQYIIEREVAAAATNNNASSVSSMGIRFPRRGGGGSGTRRRRRKTRKSAK